MNINKFKSNTAFQDMLFLMLSGVTILWVLSFLLINPVAKQNDIETPAEFLLTLEWAEESDDDLDLWLRTPNGVVISFMNKDAGGANLERDDLGKRNDCTRLYDAVAKTVAEDCVKVNREVITLRGLVPGEYQLKFVVYTTMGGVDGNPVTAEIIDVNPYKIKFKKTFTYSKRGQHISIIRFTLDEDGNLTEFSQVPAKFDMDRSVRPMDANGSYNGRPL